MQVQNLSLRLPCPLSVQHDLALRVGELEGKEGVV